MAKPAARFKLVVFDLDGTLVDTRRDLAEATNALIAELGGAPLDEALIGGLVGQGVAIWLARALALAGLAPGGPQPLPSTLGLPTGALDRFSALYDERLLVHTRPYAGIPLALEQAAAVARLAVLTNKMRAATVRILDGLDLARYFAEVLGVDGPHAPKPAPDGLRALMRTAAAAPAETLLVGDSPVDAHTARNAGARICVARYGFGHVPAAAQGDELYIDHPEELTAHLFG